MLRVSTSIDGYFNSGRTIACFNDFGITSSSREAFVIRVMAGTIPVMLSCSYLICRKRIQHARFVSSTTNRCGRILFSSVRVPIHYGNSATPQLRNSATPQLRNSATPQLRNSATPQLRNSATPQLRNHDHDHRDEPHRGMCSREANVQP